MTQKEKDEYNRRRRARYAAKKWREGKPYCPRVSTPVPGRIEKRDMGEGELDYVIIDALEAGND